MNLALGAGSPFRIEPPVTTTGALGSPVVEMAFYSGELGLPHMGLAVQAVVTVDLDVAPLEDDEGRRRRAARIVSGVARRAAASVADGEARVCVERPGEDGEICKVQFAYDELAEGMARRVKVVFELLLEAGESDDALRLRAALPATALLVRMADAVHDAVDDPAWSPVFGRS